MEIMVEIYRTLAVLGMEWKEKKNLGGLGGIPPGPGSKVNGHNNDAPPPFDGKAASGIFFIETRARVQDVVVLMNIQLYNISAGNYLVDFHHKGSYRASTAEGAGRYDMEMPFDLGEREAQRRRSDDGVEGGEESVVSPFVFMDVACSLILVLAGGGE